MNPREPVTAEGPSCDIETREERIAGWTYAPRPAILRDIIQQMHELFARDMYFVLDENHNVIEEPDPIKWAQSRDVDRHVKDEYINGYRVSTIFVGFNMNIMRLPPPQIFETMTWTPAGEIGEVYRYSTWNEAARGHEAIAAKLQKVLSN